MSGWTSGILIQWYKVTIKWCKNWDKDDQLSDRCIYTKIQNYNETKKNEISCDTDTKIQNYNEIKKSDTQLQSYN